MTTSARRGWTTSKTARITSVGFFLVMLGGTAGCQLAAFPTPAAVPATLARNGIVVLEASATVPETARTPSVTEGPTPMSSQPTWTPRPTQPPPTDMPTSIECTLVTESPTTVPPHATLDFYVFHMTTESVGLGIARDERNSNQWLVLRSTDAGEYWRDVSPLHAGAIQYADPYFMDSQNAWVVVRPPSDTSPTPVRVTVWHTADGGQTWTQGRTIAYVGDNLSGALFFLDRQRGGYEINLAGAGSWSYTLYETNDGGLTWALISMSSLLQPEMNTSSPLPEPADLTFVDAQHGWAALSSAGSMPIFYATRDGGRTWAVQPLPNVPGESSLPVAPDWGPVGLIFNSPSHGPLFVINPGSQALGTAIYVSVDSGRTWQAFQFRQHWIEGASFADDRIGYFYDCDRSQGKYTLYSTADSRRSWTPVPASFVPPGTLDFINRALGWSWRGHNGYRTQDGGLTWQAVTPSLVAR